MGARWYSPVLGRWLSPDTIVPNGKNPQAFNRYAYTLNNPVKYQDPSGHMPTCGDAKDMTGGCGLNSFVPGQAEAMDGAKEQQYENCKQGKGGCNNPWEVLAFTVGGLIGTGLLPEIAAGASEAWATAGARAAAACVNSRICAILLLGGTGAGAKAVQGSQTAAPQINLAAHEAASGHLLARHVGKTLADLAARLANSPKLQSASTLYNHASAEAAVAETLSVNQAQIATWLQGTSQGLPVTHQLGQAAGMVLSRGSSVAVEGKTVILWLLRDVAMQLGYRVHTGYLDP